MSNHSRFEHKFEPPPGWTKDPQEMFTSRGYKNPITLGHSVVVFLNQRPGTPVMSHSLHRRFTLPILKAGRYSYTWNFVAGDICRFDETDFSVILETRKRDGGSTDGLKFVQDFGT